MSCSKDKDKPVVKHTPHIAELMPAREYRCTQSGCREIFHNPSHYDMHLRRRHKLTVPKKDSTATTFHCPVERCLYHVQMVGGRSFASLRLLRQHYQKMHMEKKYKCKDCDQSFLLVHHFEAHQCAHICPICELTYNSKAALRTHMRRKNHTMEESSKEKPLPKVAIPALVSVFQAAPPTNYVEPVIELAQPLYYCLPAIEYAIQVEPLNELAELSSIKQEAHDSNDMHNFTAEEVERLLRDMETQTDDVELDVIDMAPLMRDTETQTHDYRQHQGTMTEAAEEQQQQHNQAQPQMIYDEPMFGPQTSTSMHTQTCDELFEELGLSHINTQTQTNWPEEEETDALYNTQYTQTCDQMLDELLENFQSTYTQTRWLDWQATEDTGD